MKNILLIGCGLLGSSLLRRIHKKKITKKIFVYEKSKKNLFKIKKLKLPGITVKNLNDAVSKSEIIFPYGLTHRRSGMSFIKMINASSVVRRDTEPGTAQREKIIPRNLNGRLVCGNVGNNYSKINVYSQTFFNNRS